MKNVIGRIKSISFTGFYSNIVNVEVQILKGLHSFSIVGMADKCIVESRDRIRSAFYSSGFDFPLSKIIVNLSPARDHKEGTHYDLPIALAILAATGEVKANITNALCLGELSLGGEIISTVGGIQAIDLAFKENLSLASGISYSNDFSIYPKRPESVYLANNLRELVDYLNENRQYGELNYEITENNLIIGEPFSNVHGQVSAKRAMLISAAGKHHMSLVGAPGVGKTTLVLEMPKLLPDLTEQQAIEATTIYSLANLLQNQKLIRRPQIRIPHSSASEVSLLGGIHPGECSLAHHGILFLDEFPEFKCIDSLRVPIESKWVTISRATKKIIYPCDFLLMAAMNPCKCGFLIENKCVCGKKNYMNRVSAPIQDRIDIRVYLSKPKIDAKDTKFDYQSAVKITRDLQITRQGCLNKDVDISIIDTHINTDTMQLIHNFALEKNLSMRSVNKIKRISRTIADLVSSERIHNDHVYEALLLVNYV